MTEEKNQTVLERGLDAKKFIEASIYQKVLNNLIDECISAWASSKIEEKEKREAFWHRYQSTIAMHSTLQSWIASMEQEQQAQELSEPKSDKSEIH